MPIRKNPDSGIWWIDIRTPGGQRIRRSAGTRDRRQAQEYHDRLKSELWRADRLGEHPDRIFEEAAVRFLRLSEGQKDYPTKLRHIAYWREQFCGQGLRSLTSGRIIDALPTHRPGVKGRTAISGSTCNRYLATIRRMLNLCVEWGWIDKAPVLQQFREPRQRIRWEPPGRVALLIRSMTLQWMQDVCLFAVATGMREEEILSLTPQQVDLAQRHAWVGADQTKSRRARPVPLNEDAIAVLRRRMPSAVGYVFTRDGLGTKKIYQTDARCFARACGLAKVADFHFHDLRHTWASWHVQGGTPLMVLKDLGGWETVQMVQKYAHLAPTHLAHHANTVAFWSQPEQKEQRPALRLASSS